MKKQVLMAFGALVIGSLLTARGANETFKVIERDTVNIVTAESETDVENFTAKTNKIKGTIQFDREAKTGSGILTIDGTTLDTGFEIRNQHMKSADWFNFEKNPEIRFATTRVQWTRDNSYRITGNLTLNGITKALITTATVKYTAANDATKAARIAGDSLALSTSFKIKLADFNVKHPNIVAGRVNEEIVITIKTIATNK
jgi:polyisoprenoid-binding protein YceI